MTCESCGKKPKHPAKDFTKAVVEINNPEALVLLRKVSLPASMGTEEDVPASIGKYRNVILKYEANGHIYLYSSDGIPTLLEVKIPDEIWERIGDLEEDLAELEQEFDDFKNSPDVVDIVATYSDLQAYDTSGLGDKDVVRVLSDETHDGESSYYRWNTATQTWTFIGATGPYYTKSETDTLIGAAKGSAKELTPEDYNWPTANPDGIAVWTLGPGFYSAPRGVKLYWTSSSQGVDSSPFEFIVAAQGNSGDKSINLFSDVLYLVHSDGTVILDTTFLKTSQVTDNLTSTSPSLPLSANQGRILKDTVDTKQDELTAGGNITIEDESGALVISATDTTYSDFTGTDGQTAGNAGLVPAPATTDAGKVLGADGTWVTGGPTVVQTTGISTTDVMSQDATTSMVYADPSTKRKIRIGDGATADVNHTDIVAIGTSSNAGEDSTIAIGKNSLASASSSIAIGSGSSSNKTTASKTQAIAIGVGAQASGYASIALGRAAVASGGGGISLGAYTPDGGKGVFNIGGIAAQHYSDCGYNNSAYRLLTGLYDPQNAHDAATKGYVDPSTDVSAPTTSTVGRLGQIYVDTTNSDAYMCVAVDDITPAYTWKKITP